METVAPEETHVHSRRLGPDGPVRVPGAVHGEAQQPPGHAHAPVRLVRDNGVDDESVPEQMLALAVAGSIFQLGGETIARVARVAAQQSLSRPAGQLVERELGHWARCGDDPKGNPPYDEPRVSSHGESEVNAAVIHVVVEDGLDHGPDLIFGIHEFDGSIEVERIQENVGHGANMAVMRSEYIEF